MQCNAIVPERGPVFFDFDEIDAENFLVNNPQIFINMVERYENVLQPTVVVENIQNLNQIFDEIRQNAGALQQQLQQQFNDDNQLDNNNAADIEADMAVDDSDHDSDVSMEDDADHFEIPHLGLNLLVDRNRIRLSTLVPLGADQNLDLNDPHEDVYDIPQHGVRMHVNARAMNFSSLQEN